MRVGAMRPTFIALAHEDLPNAGIRAVKERCSLTFLCRKDLVF
jgi:hypothetical protein